MKQVTVGRFGFQNAYSVGSTINTCPNFFEMSFDKTINFLSFNVMYFANYFILFYMCLGMKKHWLDYSRLNFTNSAAIY